MLEKPDEGPNAENGAPSGPASAAPDAPTPPATPGLAHPGAATEAALGLAPRMAWCTRCQAEREALATGQCSQCGGWVKFNSARRKHPKVNIAFRDSILANLLKQFPPRNILERSTCQRIAEIRERLDSGMQPGSPEWQRLVQMEQTLSASLHDSHLSRKVDSSAVDLSDKTPDELLAMLDECRARIDKDRAAIIALRDDEQQRAAAQRAAEASATITPPDTADAGPVRRADVPTAEPAPEPMCGYGCGTVAQCIEIKKTRPEAWAALHFADPSEIARRNKEATAEMLAQIGKPPRW